VVKKRLEQLLRRVKPERLNTKRRKTGRRVVHAALGTTAVVVLVARHATALSHGSSKIVVADVGQDPRDAGGALPSAYGYYRGGGEGRRGEGGGNRRGASGAVRGKVSGDRCGGDRGSRRGGGGGARHGGGGGVRHGAGEDGQSGGAGGGSPGRVVAIAAAGEVAPDAEEVLPADVVEAVEAKPVWAMTAQWGARRPG